jgi:O-antigen/teichoic acid export membrane protein
VLAAFHGTASTAVWAACLGAVALCNPVFIGLQNFFTPQLAHVYAKGKMDSLRRLTLQTIAIMGLTTLPFCLVLLVFGGSLVSGFYGSKYAGNAFIVSILAVNLLVSSLAFVPSRTLLTVGRVDVDFKINIVSLVLLCFCGIPLVKQFGLAGAAVGLLLSKSASLILFLIAFSRMDPSRRSYETADRIDG